MSRSICETYRILPQRGRGTARAASGGGVPRIARNSAGQPTPRGVQREKTSHKDTKDTKRLVYTSSETSLLQIHPRAWRVKSVPTWLPANLTAPQNTPSWCSLCETLGGLRVKQILSFPAPSCAARGAPPPFALASKWSPSPGGGGCPRDRHSHRQKGAANPRWQPLSHRHFSAALTPLQTTLQRPCRRRRTSTPRHISRRDACLRSAHGRPGGCRSCRTDVRPRCRRHSH